MKWAFPAKLFRWIGRYPISDMSCHVRPLPSISANLTWIPRGESTMRKLDLLTEMQVRNAKPAKGKFVARLLDGAGLYLQATVSQAAFEQYQQGHIKWNAIRDINRNWIFRYELDGARHDLGLGPAHTIRLKDARAKAAELRRQIYEGIDPAQERKEAKAERKARLAAEIKRITFAQCAQQYIRVHAPTWKSAKHAQLWESSLRQYA